MYKLLFPIVFATCVLAATGPIPLPSSLKTCSRSGSDFNGCLKSNIQNAITVLLKGSRPLGVLPVDPLQLTSLSINQGEGPVAIKLNFKDLSILGIGKLIIESVDAQLNGDEKSLTLTIRAPETLTLVGKYTINGKVLILPIAGTGDSKIEFYNSKASIKFTGKTVTKDGVKYLIFRSASFDLSPTGASLHFDNLFNGDKALGDNMNKFLNENWKEVYGELKTPIQQVFASTFLEITNRVFSAVPEDKIFLP